MSGGFLNVVYSSGEEFTSIHKVHARVARVLGHGISETQHWILTGRSDFLGDALEPAKFWRAGRRQIKGRGLSFWSKRLFSLRLTQDLDQLAPCSILIDGIRAARLMLPVLGSRSYARKIVVVLHGPVRLSNSDVEMFRGFPSSRLRVAAVSKGGAEYFLERYPALQDALVAIPNACSPDEFSIGNLSRSDARAKLGLSQDDVAFGAVGRLSKEKNFSLLLHALMPVIRVDKRAHLFLVGEGELRGEIEALISHHSLDAQIHLLGFRQDVGELYAAFDWLCIPSLYEGLGLVVGESLLAGTPVITSDLPVFHEQTGAMGLYASADDCSAWESLLGRVFQFPEEERCAIHAAQLKAFDVQGRWREFFELYRSYLLNLD